MLDRVRADHRRVRGGAARDQLDPCHLPDGVGDRLELGCLDPAGARDPARQRLPQRVGLLVDLLEHEVLIAALLGGLGRPLDRLGDALHRPALDVGYHDPVGPQVGDVALLEEDDLARVGQDRGDVGGEERLALAEPDDERHVLARPDESIALVAVHDRERIRTLEPPQRGARRVGDVARVRLLDQVGDGLRVRLGRQLVAARLEPVTQLLEVLDDPVMDHRDPAGAIDLGVGIDVVRAAMCRPAGVRQAHGSMRRALGDRGSQVAQLARALLDEEVALVVDQRDSG